MKIGLQGKYSLIILTLIISVVLVLAGALFWQFRSSMYEVTQTSANSMASDLLEQMKKRGEVMTRFLAESLINPVYKYDMDAMYQIIKITREQQDVIYVYIYDPMGKIIHEGKKGIPSFNKVLDDEVSRNAVGAKELLIQTSENILDVAAPIRIGDTPLGGVRVGLSLKSIKGDIAIMNHQLQEMGRRGWQKNIFVMSIITAGVITIGLFIALSVARGLIRPIKELAKYAVRVGHGEYDVYLSFERSDEIGELANSFKEMTQNLQRTTIAKNYFDNIIKSMTDTLVVLGPDGTIRMMNRAICDLLGYQADELMAQPVEKLFAKEELLNHTQWLEELKKTGFLNNTEKTYLSKDGRKIPVSFSASVMYEADGRVQGIVCVAQDMTERQQLLEALRVSEKRFHQMAKVIPAIFWMTPADWSEIIYVSPAFEKIYGRPCEHLYKNPELWLEVIHPEDRQHVITTNEKHHGEEYEIKYRILRPEGSIRWICDRVYPIRDENEKISHRIGFVEDITNQKQAEEALRKSEERFRDLFDEAPVGYYELDTDGRITRVNRTTLHLLGYSEDEILGRAPWEFIVEKETSQREFKAKITGIMPPGRSYERTFKRKDGTLMPVLAENKYILDISGRIIGIRTAILDITTRKKAEELFYKAFHASPLPISIASLEEGRFVDVNESFLNHFGCSRDEVVGHTSLELKRWGKKSERDQFVKALWDKKSLRNIELNLFTKSGECRCLNYSVELIELGGEPCDLCIGQDITERKHAEDALRESEEKYRHLFENRSDAVMIFDAETLKFEDANKAALDLYGYSKEEFLSLKVGDISAEKEKTKVAVQAAKNYGNLQVPLRYFMRKNGTIFPAEIYAGTFISSGRKKIIGAVRDITEHKLAEENLLNYQGQLRSLVFELSLTEERERHRIAGELHDRIGQNMALAKIKLAALQKMASSTSAAASLGEIRGLVDQSIKDTRSLTMELSPPVLYELGFVAAAEWLAEHIQEQYGILTEFENDGEPESLPEDVQVILFQAARELLLNVAKHSKATRAKVSIRRDKSRIRVIVEDNGVGLNISEIGSQPSRNRGFGLFNIRERLVHIGGHFEIKSETGCGTSVTLAMPLKRNYDDRKKKRNKGRDNKDSPG